MSNNRLQAVPRRERLLPGASALMLLASLLPLAASEGMSVTPWRQELAPVLVLGYLFGIAVGVVVVLDRLTQVRIPERLFGLERQRLLAVVACVSAAQLVLEFFAIHQRGSGLWLAVVAAAALVTGTVFADRIPVLRDTVTPEAGDATVPYWFNVATPVNVYDATDGSVRYTLTPGEWYLATVSYGSAVGVRDEIHGEAVLHDLAAIRRA